MTGLIDTNLLIYASSETAPEYPKAHAFMKAAAAGPAIYALTWLNIGEYLSFTTQSFAGMPPLFSIKEATSNMEILIESPFFRIITEGEEHWATWSRILRSVGPVRGSFVHDCRIATIMLENGVETIFTRDADFRKIPGLKVVDPLSH